MGQNMFIIFATKSLNDGTKGFRFNVLGKKGLVRLRKRKNNGWHIVQDDCMTAVHMGKLSLYTERQTTMRKLQHFAG
jgi:hypothetical protein